MAVGMEAKKRQLGRGITKPASWHARGRRQVGEGLHPSRALCVGVRG